MVRLASGLLLLLPFLASPQQAAVSAGDDEKIVGIWERLHEKESAKDKSKKEYIEETWIIKKIKDKWTVAGKFYQPGKGEIGNFRSKDVKFADGSLTFTQDFFKLPKGFVSGSTVTCSADEERLDVAIKPKKGEETKDNFKRAGDASEVIGIWKSKAKAGTTETWIIQKDKKGKLTVRGEWGNKNGIVTHAFNGLNVRYFQKELMFNQNFYKFPPKGFTNFGTAIACVARGDELVFIWYNGSRKGKGSLPKLESK